MADGSEGKCLCIQRWIQGRVLAISLSIFIIFGVPKARKAKNKFIITSEIQRKKNISLGFGDFIPSFSLHLMISLRSYIEHEAQLLTN